MSRSGEIRGRANRLEGEKSEMIAEKSAVADSGKVRYSARLATLKRWFKSNLTATRNQINGGCHESIR